jgi:hypothetical protein
MHLSQLNVEQAFDQFNETMWSLCAFDEQSQGCLNIYNSTAMAAAKIRSGMTPGISKLAMFELWILHTDCSVQIN